MSVQERHPHYHKNVSHLDTIDAYRVLERFGVTDPAIQHAIKKLLVAGGRGSKDIQTDIQEAIDSLTRWQEMLSENEAEAILGLHNIMATAPAPSTPRRKATKRTAKRTATRAR